MSKKYLAWCEDCKRPFDLREIHFVDADYQPIVLSAQIDGRAGRRKAINYLKYQHDAYDEADFEEGALFEYSAAMPNLSHMEPDDEGHKLTGFTDGYWSFEL